MKLNITSAVRLGDADLVTSSIYYQLNVAVPLGIIQAFLSNKEAGLLVADSTGEYFSIARDGNFNHAADYGISGCPDVSVALFTYNRGTAKIQVLRKK
jgi:hypothetical protein